jgi:dienelactone hydrolase
VGALLDYLVVTPARIHSLARSRCTASMRRQFILNPVDLPGGSLMRQLDQSLRRYFQACVLGCLIAGIRGLAAAEEPGPVFPGTKPLTMEGDIASELVAGVDRFLLKQIDASTAQRKKHWKRDLSSHQAFHASAEANRRRLAHILGVRDERVSVAREGYFLDYADVEVLPAGARETLGFDVKHVRWRAFGDVTAEGLQLNDRAGDSACIIVIPDAGQTPEQLAGLVPGVPPESQVARWLAESGFWVFVPTLIDRTVAPRNGRARLTNREFIYRSAFELGRHLIGYEVQKVLALVDYLATRSVDHRSRIGVFGYGEGGAIALYAAALDRRIDAVCASGYFDDRNGVWRQPVDRNVYGLLEQFGDAEIASLVAPRALIIEAAKGPEFAIPPGTGGAPGVLATPKLESVKAEVERARKLVAGLQPEVPIELVTSGPEGNGPFGSEECLQKLARATAPDRSLKPAGQAAPVASEHVDRATAFSRARQDRQLHELDRHNQKLLVESADVRREFMKKLDLSSLESYTKSVEPYRAFFADEVIGRFDLPFLPPNVRSRRIYDEPKISGYEVVLDVFPDVFAYGILLWPKGIKDGEKRPVVVCQHGLEGRPRDVADPKFDSPYYHRFAVQLAEQGFITFAPQNLYIFEDRFRTLQRKANPLKKTLFSVIVPQHQQITDWLKALPQVDPERIAFYGLSYGGKSAMRIPPLVKNYCLSICSADFNEWVWKNASTNSSYSYVWTGEYEIFEFDLGSTFNYAEMAALIAPRPFMVERGHFDGVAPDETVAYEFAKVNFLYDAKLGIGDRCAIEFFLGPHTINGKGTFAFLRKHLKY